MVRPRQPQRRLLRRALLGTAVLVATGAAGACLAIAASLGARRVRGRLAFQRPIRLHRHAASSEADSLLKMADDLDELLATMSRPPESAARPSDQQLPAAERPPVRQTGVQQPPLEAQQQQPTGVKQPPLEVQQEHLPDWPRQPQAAQQQQKPAVVQQSSLSAQQQRQPAVMQQSPPSVQQQQPAVVQQSPPSAQQQKQWSGVQQQPVRQEQPPVELQPDVQYVPQDAQQQPSGVQPVVAETQPEHAPPFQQPSQDQLSAHELQNLQQDQTVAVQMQVAGLRRAPLQYGENTYLATSDQIEQIVERVVQKYQASLNAMKRYANELEDELSTKEEHIDAMQARLEEEQRRRETVELERDTLQQQRASLEAKLVNDGQAKQDADMLVQAMDMEAEKVAERVSRGEISEEEAEQIEEELIRAQARRLAAVQNVDRHQKDLTEVTAASEEAARQASAAEASEKKLQEELVAMQAAMQQAREERDAEAAKREEADRRFNQLVQRIQAKAAAGNA
eukprot:TRINITY_DN5245_c0_g1_i2.p1 TRINITY_DN5245_c0_g1~~TRINITY_DN5245_c0_g1_i2.p1  ORF type:complete len:509 (-),score=171.17 TRINITY_DN5245_c0_g1_i2:138-1664(-)